jgi:anti-anti-sigma factor
MGRENFRIAFRISLLGGFRLRVSSTVAACENCRYRFAVHPYIPKEGHALMTENAATCPLTLEVERDGNAFVVRCHGRLVAGTGDVLYSRVKELIPDTKRIVLDLTDLARVDSMGLGTLVRLYVSARSAGCALELVNLGQQVRQLLGTTGLLSVFTVVGERGIRL